MKLGIKILGRRNNSCKYPVAEEIAALKKKTKVVQFGCIRHWGTTINKTFIYLEDCSICCKGQNSIMGSKKNV